MIKRLFTIVLLGAFSLHAQEKPEPPKAPDPLQKFLEKAEKGERLEAGELAPLLRSLLEKQGVPADKLKDIGLLELLRLMQEKNPDQVKGLDSLFGFRMDEKLAQKLDDHFNQLLEGHRPGAAKATAATFAFRDGKKQALALGTGVHPNGWVLTKASEVKAATGLECRVGGQWLPAKVARVWDDHDLALVKIAAHDLGVVQWTPGAAPGVGSFITAVAPEGQEPLAIGLVSVAARNQQSKGRGFLGVSLDSDEKGVKIRELIPSGPAKASGLQIDDRILALDGLRPDSVFTFSKALSDRKAGDKVKLKFQRGEEVMEKEIALGDRASQAGMTRPGFDRANNMGSTVSKRRDNFPWTLQTDLPLEANQCGGPVTDLDGRVVGVVIARSGRIETMVLPSDAIWQALATVDFAREEKAAGQSN